jgi:lipoate---protein ligase
MRLLDISFHRPEENLAFDEVLLDGAESGRTGECLRFWESRVRFVVLGVSQCLRQEVWEKPCAEDRVPILRRASAGGCVLQGPGCLNYTLILSHELHPEIKTIRESYCFILNRLCEALQRREILAHHKGISDIAVGGRKAPGTAQNRRRRFILHHGTLLYAVDPDLMTRYLREPADRPQYRGARTHPGFVRALPLDAQELRAVVCEASTLDGKPVKPHPWEVDAAKDLAREKYRSPDWTHRR